MEAGLPYFFYSLGILLREGLEAMLVIVALAAGLRQSGDARRVRDVYAGALMAVAVSIALAWAVKTVLSDDASDSLEGGFQLIAAATLFYVSSWMTARTQADRWRDFISDRMSAATHSLLPSAAIALTAFVAVLREGAETIVFFQTLIGGATEPPERRAIYAGVAAAAIALGAIFFTLERVMERIPIRLFFRTTSALLYALALIFVGQGVAGLQEASLVSATFIDYVPTSKTFGLYPTLETLIPQITMALIALAPLISRRIPRLRRMFDKQPQAVPAPARHVNRSA